MADIERNKRIATDVYTMAFNDNAIFPNMDAF